MNEPKAQPGAAYKGIEPNGFSGFAGPILHEEANGPGSVFIIDCGENHLNGDDRIHGGVLMSLASTTLRQTIAAANPDMALRTLSINCDFLSAGDPGARLEGRARITRTTRSVIFASCEIVTGGRVLVTASGVYAIEGGEKA